MTHLWLILCFVNCAPRNNLVNNQLEALLNVFIFFTSLHFCSNPVLIIRRVNCISTLPGMYHSVYVTA